MPPTITPTVTMGEGGGGGGGGEGTDKQESASCTHCFRFPHSGQHAARKEWGHADSPTPATEVSWTNSTTLSTLSTQPHLCKYTCKCTLGYQGFFVQTGPGCLGDSMVSQHSCKALVTKCPRNSQRVNRSGLSFKSNYTPNTFNCKYTPNTFKCKYTQNPHD